MITVKSFAPPEWSIKEILRYSGCREQDERITAIINECINEVSDALSYKVCFTRLDITRNDELSFGNITTPSKALEKALSGCDELVLFGATVGIGLDRLIAKYNRISPARALIFQAIGAERIESLCDAFCAEISDELCTNGRALKPRVSPGYGDISIELQRDIFALLDCPRKIGLTLNSSLLMSPSKSVTAIAGITSRQGEGEPQKCEVCQKADCEFRRNS